jgi:hypothetical protein
MTPAAAEAIARTIPKIRSDLQLFVPSAHVFTSPGWGRVAIGGLPLRDQPCPLRGRQIAADQVFVDLGRKPEAEPDRSPL